MMMKLAKRRFEPDDKFFEAGNLICRLLQEVYFPPVDDVRAELRMEEDEYRIDCQIQGCFQRFLTLRGYEDHYASRHRNVCGGCSKILPTKHLLDIHLNEQHNPMFEALASKSPMYECLVTDCCTRFTNARQRRKHLIEVHRYPPSFRFERTATSKSKKPVVKEADKQTVAMDTSCDKASEVKPSSRFKYNYKVPASISFGQGVQRGFYGKRSKRSKGNHLVKPQSSSAEHAPLVNIEEVDMNDLARALGT